MRRYATLLVAVLGAVGCGNGTLHPYAGTFVATGSMVAARQGHTATLLPSGQVLVVGGVGPSAVLSSAELYDPVSGTFGPTAPSRPPGLATFRRDHTATLLNNGKVLIAGGTDGNTLLASSELYDPATGTFTPTGGMLTARAGHTATLLGNGKVLFAGVEGSVGSLANAELYDPDSGTCTPTGGLLTPLSDAMATLLNTGKVLVAGGQEISRSFATVLSTAELYDPVAGTFAFTGNLPAGRIRSSAALLRSGALLITGGIDTTAFLNSSVVYDPSTGTFAAAGDMAASREEHTTTLLPTGKVLIAGGYGSKPIEGTAGVLGSAELYDPVTGIFTDTGRLVTSRYRHTATLLNNGYVLIVGGYNGPYVADLNFTLGSAELYRPSNALTAP